MTIKSYLFDRREGFITRWHAEPVLRHESLAEHSYFVARNALMVCHALVHFGIAKPDIGRTMELALTHDLAEKETGDISGKAKRLYPSLKKVLTEIETSEVSEVLFKELPENIGVHYKAIMLLYANCADIESQIVSYVGILDAHAFAQVEFELGNSYALDPYQRTSEWMRQLDWPWLEELRKHVDIP